MAKKKKETKKADLKKMIELLYMTENEVTAKKLKEVIPENNSMVVEFWENMSIIQLELENGNSVDIEQMEGEFTEESDKAFIKNRNVKTIFYVTMEEEDLEKMKPILKEILLKLGGFICTDSEKFQPIYTKDNL